MNRAIRDIYFIMFRPIEEQVRGMSSKRNCVSSLGELFYKFKEGSRDYLYEREKIEAEFENIILKYGAEDGIRKRYNESRGQKGI